MEQLRIILQIYVMFDLLCFNAFKPLGCQALGMESGAISDKQIKASSQWDSNHAPFQGRLHFKGIFEGGSWSAGKNDLHQWLQVDLGSQYTKVTRVATQGRNAYSQWVTKYKLTYSDDRVNFQYYREQGQTADKVHYYIDMAIVKFIQNHMRNSAGVFPISSLVKISMISPISSLSLKLYLNLLVYD